jgi:acyl carrier protein phosphodiesterase
MAFSQEVRLLTCSLLLLWLKSRHIIASVWGNVCPAESSEAFQIRSKIQACLQTVQSDSPSPFYPFIRLLHLCLLQNLLCHILIRGQPEAQQSEFLEIQMNMHDGISNDGDCQECHSVPPADIALI